MIFQSPLEHHIENVLMFCHKAGLQAKQISDASTLWVNYARALENLQGRKIDGQYQAVNLIVGPNEASAFCRMLSSDALSLLDDRNQDQVISQTCDPHAREKADLLLAAMECLGALSRQHKHLFDLLITDIFLMPSQEARGGSTSSAIGVIWANPKTSYRVPDIVEFLVHELTHHALFIDEHRYGHYDYSVILDQETWAQSALLKTPRPLDKVIHSIIVATEIILFREQCLGHPAAPLVHPPTAKICAQVSQSVESVENQIAALLRQGVTPVSPRVRDLLNQVRDIVTSDRIKKISSA